MSKHARKLRSIKFRAANKWSVLSDAELKSFRQLVSLTDNLTNYEPLDDSQLEFVGRILDLVGTKSTPLTAEARQKFLKNMSDKQLEAFGKALKQARQRSSENVAAELDTEILRRSNFN